MSDRVVTILKCDECDASFEASYDPTWETVDDAAWLESCAGCGMTLCDKCKKVHRENNCESKTLDKLLKDWNKTGELAKFPIGRILR
jgi:hypothetical protein